MYMYIMYNVYVPYMYMYNVYICICIYKSKYKKVCTANMDRIV